MEPWMAADTQNGVMDAQNEGVYVGYVGQWSQIRIAGAGSGSGFTLK
jgi:hypothetical protein